MAFFKALMFLGMCLMFITRAGGNDSLPANFESLYSDSSIPWTDDYPELREFIAGSNREKLVSIDGNEFQESSFHAKTIELIREYIPGFLSGSFEVTALYRPAQTQANPEAFAILQSDSMIVVCRSSVRNDYGAPGNTRFRQDQLHRVRV